MCEQGIVNTKRADSPPKECSSLEEVLQHVAPGGSVIISGPNENSPKASISVYVLAANSQDEDYEGTTRPRPESDKQTRKLDDEMNDIETEEKSNNNDPDWVSNGKQAAVHGERANLTRLVLVCIEAKFCK